MVRFGSGSIDDDQGPVSKASSPSNAQKIKYDDILAQASVYEADMDARLAALDYKGALVSFDMIIASLTGVPAGNTKMQDVRAKFEKALDMIGFETVSVPSETTEGIAFKKDFTARVFVTVASVKKPLAAFECIVSYPSTAEDGTRSILTLNTVSSADGLISFTAPVPSRSGRNKVVFASALTCKDALLRDSITTRRDKGQLSVSFAHLAGSSAKRAPTTIAILDYNKDGKAQLSGNISATTLLKPLVQKGFGRIGMADFPNQLAAGDEAALIKGAKSMFGSGVQRFIFGTTHIESLVQGDDLLWSCTFAVQINVWDFILDSKIYVTEIRSTQTAKTEAAAIDAARKKVCAELLVSDLYYNM